MSHSAKHYDDVVQAIGKIESADPNVVIQGINVLTKKSFEALEQNNVHFENYPQLAISIGSLLDVVDPLSAYIYSCTPAAVDNSQTDHWPATCPCTGNVHVKALAYNVDDNAVLLSILNILRNLSFDAVNEQIMAASTPFMQHLVSMLVVSIATSTCYQATHLALDALINIGSRIDLTGRKRLQGYYYSEDATKLRGTTDALQKSLLQLRLCNDMSMSSYSEYLTAVTTLTSAIAAVICGHAFNDRNLTLRSLELLGKLAGNPDNVQYLSRCPAELVAGIVQLLCTSTTFAEPLVSDVCQINGDPLGRRRMPAAVCLNTRSACIPFIPPPTTAAASTAGTAGASNTSTTQGATSAGTPGLNFNPFGNGSNSNSGPPVPPSDPMGGASSGVYITFGGLRADAVKASASYSTLEVLGSSSAPSASAAPVVTTASGMSSFFTDASDLEMRDQVLETLHALCMLGVPMQLRLLQVPRLVEILLRIATSGTHFAVAGAGSGASGGAGSGGSGAGFGNSGTGGVSIQRSEGVLKALQILSALLALAEGNRAFLGLQSEFMAAACSDDFIAEVVCNKALPVHHDIRARIAYSLQQQQQLDLQFAAESQPLM